MKPGPFLLCHRRALGDVVAMTALVRDLHRSLGPGVDLAVDTTFPEVWKNNPYLVPAPQGKRNHWTVVKLSYGAGIRSAKSQKIHFLRAWHDDFLRQTGLEIPLTDPRPDLHLSEQEWAGPVLPPEHPQSTLLEERLRQGCWLINAGGKLDFTTKIYSTARLQTVVDGLGALGLACVQVGGQGHHPTHWHPALRGVLNLVGQTSLRQLVSLAARSAGTLCTITAAMHLAAAFERPCVVTAGGREEPWWEGYVNDYPGAFGPAASPVRVPHRFLHTLGLLDCCPAEHACWKSKVRPASGDPPPAARATDPRPAKTKRVDRGGSPSLCVWPDQDEQGQEQPHCLTLLPPAAVLAAVLGYYADGTLSPLEPGVLVPRPITPGDSQAPAAQEVTLPDGRSLRVVIELLPVNEGGRPATDRSPSVTSTLLPPVPGSAPGRAPPFVATGEKPVGQEDPDGGQLRARSLHPPTRFLPLRPASPQGAPASTSPAPAPSPQPAPARSPTPLPAGTFRPESPTPSTLWSAARNPKRAVALQHPSLGGKLTVFVLSYGDHAPLLQRSVEALLGSTHPDDVEIRLAGNQLGDTSRRALRELEAAGQLCLAIDNPTNDLKYPVMRRLFRDPERPVLSKWLLWLDDDTLCNRAADWLQQLALCLQGGLAADPRLGMAGPRRIFTLSPGNARWVRQASWYRGRHFQDSRGRPAPGAQGVHFAVGAFWALRRECIETCDLPDHRLGNNGGDWAVGASLWQNQYGLANFSPHKEIVNWSADKRRGRSDPHPQA